MKTPVTHPQVALVGGEVSRHESWEEAVAHVFQVIGDRRDATWCRYIEGGIALVDRRRPWPDCEQPIARILNPQEYQAAKSRGDLESDEAADHYFRRAGGSTPARQTQKQTTMNKPAKQTTDKPEKTTYIVTDKAPGGRMMIATKVVRTGQTADVLPMHEKATSFQRWIAQGWVRLATEEERSAPPPPPPGDATDRKEVSVAVPNQAAAVQVQMVALALIKPDPTQPRQDFEEASMQELVDSIKVQGVLQPILVRPMSRWRQIVSFVARQWARAERKELHRELVSTDLWSAGVDTTVAEMMDHGGFMGRLVAEGRIERSGTDGKGIAFRPLAGALAPPTGDRSLPGESEWLEIVYGERRWRAAQAAGLTEIRAQVWELSDVDAAEKQAIENLDREGLKPLEEAHQYRKLLDQPGYTIARVVETTGKAKNTIYGKLKLLDLPEEARKAVAVGTLPAVTAERIARLESRAQAVAVKSILHAKPYELEDGKKVPSDRQCQEIIRRIEEQVAIEARWEEAQTDAQKKGITCMSAKEAEEEETYNLNGEPKYGSRYVKGSQRCELHPERWTWSKVLGKGAGELTKYLGRDTKGNGHVWMLRADAEAKAKELGVKLSAKSGGGGSSSMSANEKARAAAARKKAQLQRQQEDAGMAQILATIEKTEPHLLPRAFWRALATTLAKDACFDCTRRVKKRRGMGKTTSRDRALETVASGVDARGALALVTEIATTGVRGSYQIAKNITRMRVALGLAKAGAGSAEVDPDEAGRLLRATGALHPDPCAPSRRTRQTSSLHYCPHRRRQFRHLPGPRRLARHTAGKPALAPLISRSRSPRGCRPSPCEMNFLLCLMAA